MENKELDIQISELMYEHAHMYYQHGLVTWKNDKSMNDMYDSDYADLKHIAKLIEDGSPHAAGDYADRLDTAVRDEIPNEVWEYIHSAQA